MNFRVWNNQNCKYDLSIFFMVSHTGQVTSHIPNDIYNLEYGSGVLDKHGNEIFEGDIVKYRASHYKDQWSFHEVKFKEAAFHPQKIFFDPEREIVSTIHDNH